VFNIQNPLLITVLIYLFCRENSIWKNYLYAQDFGKFQLPQMCLSLCGKLYGTKSKPEANLRKDKSSYKRKTILVLSAMGRRKRFNTFCSHVLLHQLYGIGAMLGWTSKGCSIVIHKSTLRSMTLCTYQERKISNGGQHGVQWYIWVRPNYLPFREGKLDIEQVGSLFCCISE